MSDKPKDPIPPPPAVLVDVRGIYVPPAINVDGLNLLVDIAASMAVNVLDALRVHVPAIPAKNTPESAAISEAAADAALRAIAACFATVGATSLHRVQEVNAAKRQTTPMAASSTATH